MLKLIGKFRTAMNKRAVIWRAQGKVRLASTAVVDTGSVVSTSRGGSICLGKKSAVRRGAMIQSYGGDITIGDNCTIQPYAMIYGGGPLKIGDGVRIASHTVVVASSHNFEDPDQPIFRQGISRTGITIEDDVWIGANVTVTDGSHIARGCVIGAGAVVRGRTEPYGVYAGVPARLIRKRGLSVKHQIDEIGIGIGGAGISDHKAETSRRNGHIAGD